jgi:LPXTG-site transpeptidase (sortase) family protein
MPREKLLPKRPLQRPSSSVRQGSPRKNILKTPYNRQVEQPRKLKSSSHSHFSKATVDKQVYVGARIQKESKKLDILMKVFFTAGFLFLAVFLALWINQEVQLAVFTPKVTPTKQIQAKKYAIPTQLMIPKVHIDLPIEETAIAKGIWEISENGASHLAISARPGETGTIIMYGHNTNNRLGPIRWLSKGEKIQLKAADGKTYIYVITHTMQVASDKVDILNQKGETLVLYTCDGFADLQRFVVIAKKLRLEN